MLTETYVVPSAHAIRIGNNQIVVPYDPTVVGENPVVILTPRLDQQNAPVTNIPTVSGLGKHDGVPVIYITDLNVADNYVLNILLINPDIDMIHGLPGQAGTQPKTQKGQMDIITTLTTPVNLLTPFWNGSPLPVGSVETVTGYSKGDGPNVTVSTVSRNASPGNYSVHHVSVEENGAIPHQIQSGQIYKRSGQTVHVDFYRPWDSPPVVFATPNWGGSGLPVGSIETVSVVTENYFKLASNNRADNYSVNWVAVSSNPKFHTDHVELGIKHFLKHFSKETAFVNDNKSEIMNIIVNGAAPSAALQQMPFENRPELPEDTRDDNSATIAGDFALLAVDGVALIFTCVGAVAAANQSMKKSIVSAVAKQLAAAPDELDALVQDLEGLIKKAKDAEDAVEKANYVSRIILKVSVALSSIGAFTHIVAGLAEGMSKLDWIILSIKLASQIAVMALGAAVTAGAGLLVEVGAWIARLTALVLTTYSVSVDIRKLIHDWGNSGSTAPA